MTVYLVPSWPLPSQLIGGFVVAFLISLAAAPVVRNRRLPGPLLHKFTALPYLFYTLLGSADIYANKLHKKHGPIVQIGPSQVSINDVAGMRDVFVGTRRLDRSEALPFFHNYGAENLVSTVEGALHQDRRRPLRNIYAAKMADSEELTQVIRSATRGMLRLAEERAVASSTGAVEIRPLFQFALYDVISYVVYGPRHKLNLVGNAQQRAAMQKDVDFQEQRQISVAAGIMFLLPSLTLWLRKMGLAPKWLDGQFHVDLYSDHFGRKVLEDLQSSCSDQTEDYEGLMHRLYTHFRDNGPSTAVPSLEYVLSDSLDNFWAGVSTTSDGLIPLFRHLSLPGNSHRQERLRVEIRKAAIETGTSPCELSAGKLKQLPFLNAVIKETLRLHPPIPFSMERKTTNLDEALLVHGHNIPAGWKITSQAMSMQRKEEVFDEAECWLPERWLEGEDKLGSQEGLNEMKANFYAFGSGPRMCLGINVAWSTMRGIVAGVYGGVGTEIAYPTEVLTRSSKSPSEQGDKDIGIVTQWMQEKRKQVWLRFVKL